MMSSWSTSHVDSITTVGHRQWSPVVAIRCGKLDSIRCGKLDSITVKNKYSNDDDDEHYYSKRSLKYWDKFYKRHQNKFFKDRHYLVKDWGSYFSCDNDDDKTSSMSSNRKVVLEVGCGAGNTIYPLVAAFPNLDVHACDFSPQAISLVKSHSKFNADQMNVFVCDVANDDLCTKINQSSVDIITLIFTLSAVSPNKMSAVLQNLNRVLKPNGYILFRDYAIGDSAQVKLQQRNQLISENFYFRGDGTCSFYFSEEFLSSLFLRAGFNIVDVNIHCRQTENRLRNITMQRRWIRATFGRL